MTVIHMQLVSVLYSESELSSADLQQCIQTRGREKAVVTITLSNDRVVVERKPSGGASKVRCYGQAFKAV